MTRHFIVSNIHPAWRNSSSFNLPLLRFHQLPSACSHTSSPNLVLSSSCSFHLQHHLLVYICLRDGSSAVAVKGTVEIAFLIIASFLEEYYLLGYNAV
jgi:hypothetical protein